MSDSGSQPPTPVVSRDELLQRVDGDMELLEELVDLFLEDLPDRLQGLREALDQDDVPQVHELAHSIKGSVSCFAAAAAFEAASQLTDLARSGTRNGLKEAIDILEQEMTRLQPALQEIVASDS